MGTRFINDMLIVFFTFWRTYDFTSICGLLCLLSLSSISLCANNGDKCAGSSSVVHKFTRCKVKVYKINTSVYVNQEIIALPFSRGPASTAAYHSAP